MRCRCTSIIIYTKSGGHRYPPRNSFGLPAHRKNRIRRVRGGQPLLHAEDILPLFCRCVKRFFRDFYFDMLPEHMLPRKEWILSLDVMYRCGMIASRGGAGRVCMRSVPSEDDRQIPDHAAGDGSVNTKRRNGGYASCRYRTCRAERDRSNEKGLLLYKRSTLVSLQGGRPCH